MEECGELDLTPVQYAALVAVREHPGIDATRLSSLIAFDRSTLGNVLERLEARKLVQRYASPEDKRVKLLRLSPAGVAMLARARAPVARAQQRVLEPLKPADRERFVALLEQLV